MKQYVMNGEPFASQVGPRLFLFTLCSQQAGVDFVRFFENVIIEGFSFLLESCRGYWFNT
jgi:hypothetical protein